MKSTSVDDPPDFVRLVAHPLRWRLLRELTGSDRAVWELTQRTGATQNLVSYHLRRLRDGGIVRVRRSAADGRDCYYAIDLVRCDEQLQATGAALHPALVPGPAPPARIDGGDAARPRVLFLCTGNSSRSQMAEALLTHLSGGTVAAASAGSHPKPLSPDAIAAMGRRGIDISAHRTKHVEELAGESFDVVITLCDRVREVCPQFPSHPELVHWSIPDPAPAGATACEEAAAELEARIRFLIPLLAQRRRSHEQR